MPDEDRTIIACPTCGKRYTVLRDMVGKRVRCRQCSEPFTAAEADSKAYSETVRRLRESYTDRIFVGKGIEVCYQPDRMSFILDFLGSHEFDLVILSVHYFGADAVFKRRNWEDVGAVEGTKRYLEMVRDAARFCERLHRSNGRVL